MVPKRGDGMMAGYEEITRQIAFAERNYARHCHRMSGNEQFRALERISDLKHERDRLLFPTIARLNLHTISYRNREL